MAMMMMIMIIIMTFFNKIICLRVAISSGGGDGVDCAGGLIKIDAVSHSLCKVWLVY